MILFLVVCKLLDGTLCNSAAMDSQLQGMKLINDMKQCEKGNQVQNFTNEINQCPEEAN